MMFPEHLLCAKHHGKSCAQVISFYSHKALLDRNSTLNLHKEKLRLRGVKELGVIYTRQSGSMALSTWYMVSIIPIFRALGPRTCLRVGACSPPWS